MSVRALFAVLTILCAGPVVAAELKPFQQDALDRILATMDAETRQFARPQLEQMLGTMNEAQVQMMLQSMVEQAPDNPPEEMDEVAADAVATPADLEFNRAQYEPALREAWQASHEFDKFVDGAIAKHCPSGDTYAVYGAGWRYEVYPLQPAWTRASDSADLDVQILGSSYAPQDGRYEFDFSAARNRFDRADVERAIADACAKYRRIGEQFMKDARAGMEGDYLPKGFELEQAANSQVSPVSSALGDTLTSLGPTGNAAILNALLNGSRVE